MLNSFVHSNRIFNSALETRRKTGTEHRVPAAFSLYREKETEEKEASKEKEQRSHFKRSPPLSLSLSLSLSNASIYEYVSEAWKGRCEVSRRPSSCYAIRPLMATLSLLSTPQKALHALPQPSARFRGYESAPHPPFHLDIGDGAVGIVLLSTGD